MTTWPSCPTLLSDIPASDYHGDIWGSRERPTFSRSIAVELLQRSPRHAYARHPKLGGRVAVEDDEDEPDDGESAESTEGRDHGSLYHNLLLGGGNDFEVIEGFDNFLKKEARAKRDAAVAAGKIPIIAAKWQAIRRISDRMKIGLVEAGISLAESNREVVALWESEGEREVDPCPSCGGSGLRDDRPCRQCENIGTVSGKGEPIRCKAMMDLVYYRVHNNGPYAAAIITDLKVVKQVSTNAFVRSLDRFGYDMQAAFYIEGIEAIYPDLAGRVKFQFALVEKRPPYDVAIIQADKMLLAIGSMKLRVARARWVRCLATNAWPGVGHFSPHIPPYMLNDAVSQFVSEFGTDALPELEVGV